MCGANECGNYAAIQIDGTCKTCPSGMVADSNTKTTCVYPYVAPAPPPPSSCIPNARQIKSPDGINCIDCPNYTRAQQGNTKYCSGNNCGNYAILKIDGTCKTCPNGMVADSNTKTTCVNPAPVPVVPAPVKLTVQTCTPNARQLRSPDGLSCTDCPNYTRA